LLPKTELLTTEIKRIKGLIFLRIRKETVFNRKIFEVFYLKVYLSKYFRKEEAKITA